MKGIKLYHLTALLKETTSRPRAKIMNMSSDKSKKNLFSFRYRDIRPFKVAAFVGRPKKYFDS